MVLIMGISVLMQLGLALCGSAAILPRAEDDRGFLSYPIVHRQTHRKLTGRDTGVSLHNQSIITYLFELDIGTPAQRVEVVLDTGSFELWVDPTCSGASNEDQAASCQAAGLYDPSSSTTAVDMDATNQLPYGKGVVNIAYVADSIQLPGSGSSKTLKEVIFGVGLESQDLSYGIAGVGHGNGYNLEYDNLIDALYGQGVTNSRAFSVALGSKDGSGGTVIFGGVDTKKFSGNLVQLENLPPQMEQGQPGMVRFWIQLDSIGITQPGGKSSTYPNSGLPVVLDTGATLSYLPESIVSQFAADFDATLESGGVLSVDCSKASQAGTVDFNFGAQTIRVPFREFLVDVGGGACVVGALPVDATTPILGDSFLRSAYVVFDIDGGAIYLAQHQDCGTNEKALPAGNGAAGKFEGECKGSANAAPRASSGGAWGVFTMAAVALGIQSLFVLVL